jgi:hypothetical protein
MFRKSRKSATNVPSNATNVPQSPRFLQADSNGISDSEGAPAAFSVGVLVKPKSPGFFSRLFKRSNEELKAIITTNLNGSTNQPRRKSLWQRSKSILRPRSVLDRSESTVLDLPTTQLNIRGSGSAAELLMNEFPIEEFYAKESAVDTDGLLMKIFEANQAMYEQLKGQERQKDAARMNNQVFVNNPVLPSLDLDLDGIITPVLTSTELEDVCEKTEVSVNENLAVVTAATVISGSAKEEAITAVIIDESPNDHHHFADNPQLDSPLYRNKSESFSNSSNSNSNSNSGSSVLLDSFSERNLNLNEVDSMSLTEIAEMFDCLTVNEPETLKDGNVRCVFETENGSEESILFHNWKQDVTLNQQQEVPLALETEFSANSNSLRTIKSEEKLKFTEISVATEEAAKSLLKHRSMSLATFSKVESQSQVPVDRRRSLGAKVSQIVAMFEGAAHF